MIQAKIAIAILTLAAGTVQLDAAAPHRIYNEKANAAKLIQAAIAAARRTGKNVALVFGANWCPDCRALDAQMHQGELARILRNDFVVVTIGVADFNRNVKLAARYGIPMLGIPAVAILDSHGKLLYAQARGQFADARDMPRTAFLAFFKKWEPCNDHAHDEPCSQNAVGPPRLPDSGMPQKQPGSP